MSRGSEWGGTVKRSVWCCRDIARGKEVELSRQACVYRGSAAWARFGCEGRLGSAAGLCVYGLVIATAVLKWPFKSRQHSGTLPQGFSS